MDEYRKKELKETFRDALGIVGWTLIIAGIAILLSGCVQHKQCSCENTNIGNRVYIDLSQCYEYDRCEDLNEIINYDNCMDI